MSAWEDKMRTSSHVRADGQHRTGVNVNQLGSAFRKPNMIDTKKQGWPQDIIFAKQTGNAATHVISTMQAFMHYFKA